ncbi:SIMPL domain-containing protein [Tigheibacillus jepli]
MHLGIRQEDMQTTAFTIQPMYDYVENKQVFRGFAVRNKLTVSLQYL